MGSFIKFFKTTITGGLVVIVPLAIVFYIVANAVESLIAVTRPFTVDLPFDSFTNAIIVALIVIVIIMIVCFIAGYMVSTLLGASIKNWFERNLLEHIPMYSTLRGLTQQIVGIEGADYPVVEADLYNSDDRVLGILIEELPDNRQIIYIPLSPVVTVGQLHILPKHRVSVTNLSMAETLGCISQMGLETKELYKKQVES